MPESMNWGLAWPFFLGALVVGYLLGSIPFGIILTRLTGAGDLRKIGSGNIGATNVLRTGRKGLAAATLLGDALKGTLAVVLVHAYAGPSAALLAALGAFLGHVFPIWLGFRGGKGVATYLGCLLGLAIAYGTSGAWLAVLVFCLTWMGLAYAMRYSSLSALFATLAAPAVLWLMGERQAAELFILLTALLWLKHYDNIRRLMAGTEGRIGQKG
jgi:glycerol-3-phosphate acyltransferase PlsY